MKIISLKAAIVALGDDPEPAVLKTLQDALKKAKQHATPSPTEVLVDSCAMFVERVRNRLNKADVATREWQALREKFATDLVKVETDDGHAEDKLLANLPHPGVKRAEVSGKSTRFHV